MELELIRDKVGPFSVGGKLAIDGVFECYTLERAYQDPVFQPIPIGRYPIQILDSPHFKRRIPHILNVPGRTAIEIHAGNRPSDSHGCVIVGKQRAEDAVYTSEIALDTLTQKLEKAQNPLYIEVKGVIDEKIA